MTVNSPSRQRCSLPASLIRGGTSKGLFIRREHLPENHEDWAPILVSSMGRGKSQIDGVGAGTTVTSKVAVISKSDRPEADVDYTFVQVVVGDDKIDMTGNCGNMAAGVGPFALDEGIVACQPGQTHRDIRVFNTNTNKLLVATIETDFDGYHQEVGDYQIAGVEGFGSKIKVAFLDPAGSMTGKLFPTGVRQNEILVQGGSFAEHSEPFSIKATLVDAGNPWVLIDGSSFPTDLLEASKDLTENFLTMLEAVRQEGAVAMGLAKSIEEAASTRGTPKIAIMDRWQPKTELESKLEAPPDISVRGFSGGKLHPSFHISGALSAGACVMLPGTVAYNLRTSKPGRPDLSTTATDFDITISHPGGTMDVSVKVSTSNVSNDGVEVKSASLFRTAHKMFQGTVYY